jgi:hypothetical protein
MIMATAPTETATKTSNLTLSTSLDRAGELQILYQGKPDDAVDAKGSSASVTIKSFEGWTLTASHVPYGSTTTPPVTWEVDRTGVVGYTLQAGSVTVTVVATQSSTSTEKKKDIRVTVKPLGSGKGGLDQPGNDDGPGHGHGRG